MVIGERSSSSDLKHMFWIAKQSLLPSFYVWVTIAQLSERVTTVTNNYMGIGAINGRSLEIYLEDLSLQTWADGVNNKEVKILKYYPIINRRPSYWRVQIKTRTALYHNYYISLYTIAF